MVILSSLVIGYLLGSVSFSYLIGKMIRKIDIREYGSGNAGATNTLRVLGTGPAIVVLILDVLKGVAAVLISQALGGEEWIPVLAGLFAIVGHNWPLFSGFRGGKGVATTIGVFVTIAPFPALIAGGIAILLIILTRFVSLGSLAFVTLTPFVMLLFFDYPLVYFYIALIIVILSYWKHRSNISKLLQGNENKIGEKTKIHESSRSIRK